jgi:hypothetical protein
VTIKTKSGTTTHTHDHPVDGVMAKALKRHRVRREGESRPERLLRKRERLVAAEQKLRKR